MVNECISQIIQESGLSEFSWSKLNNAKNCFCAEKIISFIVENIYKYNLRVDVVVWDTYDSRHKIIGRDDLANYERMFYHLLNNSLKKRPQGSVWHIIPDQRSGIDWETVQDCLMNTGKKREYKTTLFGSFFADPFYNIKSFKEGDSKKKFLIQVADLFSGLSVFSREKYPEYLVWKKQNQQQLPLFWDTPTRKKFSNREKYRCQLLEIFNDMCKKSKLGVSLETAQCLKTFEPSNPINFWLYEPQGSYDKAPIR